MDLVWITMKVNNLDKAKEFYGDLLEMQIEREFSLPDGRQFTFYISENGVQIELIYDGNTKEKGMLSDQLSIGISVANYNDILEVARNKNILTSEPVILGGELECYFIEDPDGNSIQVMKKL